MKRNQNGVVAMAIVFLILFAFIAFIVYNAVQKRQQAESGQESTPQEVSVE